MTCTKEQIKKLMENLDTQTLETAAAKAGMSIGSAKRYAKGGKHRKEGSYKPRQYATRKNPFADSWEEVKELLTKDSGLQAKTIFEWLQTEYPDKYQNPQLRTLQRMIRKWRVLEGPNENEVMFPQDIKPGKQSQSDYTHCNELQITIKGEPFKHLLYHFMLPYSRWEFAQISFSESFETLTDGYKKAVNELQMVAGDHRTDNLAAAVPPMGTRGEFQKRWEDFLKYYGVKPSSNNPNRSNENGSVEKSHDLLKTALDQRLRMRGSREFDSIGDYETYVKQLVKDRNAKVKLKFSEEIKHLKPLPLTPFNDPKIYSCSVNCWSTVSIKGSTYSVPSKYIRKKLRVVEVNNELDLYYSDSFIQKMPKLPSGGQNINYRHIILELIRKPGAFEEYKFREEMFPSSIFRKAYDKLKEANNSFANKEYLQILFLAARNSEHDVAIILEMFLEANIIPASKYIKELLLLPNNNQEIKVFEPELTIYDNLLSGFNLNAQNEGEVHASCNQ